MNIRSEIKPIKTDHLFPATARKLITLLKSLTPVEWAAKTCYPSWQVRDIAAHLLQTGLGRLSRQRDGHPPGLKPNQLSFSGLASLIDRLNTEWQQISQAFSPRCIISFLAVTEFELARFFSSLDPDGEALYSVTWAGESISNNWFDIAREYTERWHHQQQIREATGRGSIAVKRFLLPVIRTLMRAVPHWYENMTGHPKVTVGFRITGDCGGLWTYEKDPGATRFYQGAPVGNTDATVTLSADVTWRLLTRSIRPEQARPLIQFEGNHELAYQFLNVKAILMKD